MQFTALRELPGTDLGRLFLKGMNDNSPKDRVQRHALASTRLIEVFSGRSKMLPGESFAMEFVPGKGTTFYILGKAQGEPVGDDEFFQMVLKIWVGESPADHLLRDAARPGQGNTRSEPARPQVGAARADDRVGGEHHEPDLVDRPVGAECRVAAAAELGAQHRQRADAGLSPPAGAAVGRNRGRRERQRGAGGRAGRIARRGHRQPDVASVLYRANAQTLRTDRDLAGTLVDLLA